MVKTDSDKCWGCGGGKQQTHHHLFIECRAWAPQARKMWGAIGKACGWKHPKAPSVRHLWKDKSTEAGLDFRRDARVGCMVNVRRLPREGGEEGEGETSEEDGPGPP